MLLFSQEWRIVDAVVKGPIDSVIIFEHAKHPGNRFKVETSQLHAKECAANIGEIIEVDFSSGIDFGWTKEILQARGNSPHIEGAA